MQANLIKGCPCSQLVLLAAKFAGVELKVNEVECNGACTMSKKPALVLEDGAEIMTCKAAARYIARKTPLVGVSDVDKAHVDQWSDFCGSICAINRAWVEPIVHDVPACPEAVKKAKAGMRDILKVLNDHLLPKTYLVGERLTLADIFVFCGLRRAYELVMEPGYRKQFVNTNRWFCMMKDLPKVVEVCGETVLCTKAKEPKKPEEKPKEEKKAKQEKPKQEKKAKEADDEEDEAPKEKPKAKNPLDLLPPAKFEMDEWKRVYSNNDTLTVAAPWLWEHWDPEGYSLWWSRYKYEHEEPQVFMVANGLRGWMQRLDPLRKYGFGSLCIFGDEKPFVVECLWMFRGKEVPPEMSEGDDAELYDWIRVDVDKERERVNAFLAWEGNFGNGLKFNQGKIYK